MNLNPVNYILHFLIFMILVSFYFKAVKKLKFESHQLHIKNYIYLLIIAFIVWYKHSNFQTNLFS